MMSQKVQSLHSLVKKGGKNTPLEGSSELSNSVAPRQGPGVPLCVFFCKFPCSNKEIAKHAELNVDSRSCEEACKMYE